MYKHSLLCITVGVVILGAAGCAGVRSETPEFPVYWGEDVGLDRPCLWIVPRGKDAFESEKLRLPKDRKTVRLRARLYNCTGRALFVHHDMTKPYVEFTIRAVGKRGVSEWPVLGSVHLV